MSRNSLKVIIPLFMIAWILLIFAFSLDSASNQKSSSVSEKIHGFISEELSGTFIGYAVSSREIDVLLRKGSHFIEYLILCIVLLTMSTIFKVKLQTSIIYILFACLLIANLDELLQSIVIKRSSMVSDCFIDFGGSLTGLLIFIGFKRIQGRLKPPFSVSQEGQINDIIR